MVKKRFIDKSKSVHYQVVHRSQRDPLLADQESSTYVLKPMPPSYNLLKKGKYDADMPDDEEEYPEFEERDGEYDGSDFSGDDDDFDDDEYDEDEHEGEEEDEKDGEQKGEEVDAVKKGEKTDKKTVRKNHKGKASTEGISSAQLAADPSLYGIFFDDNDNYDYLKHLRPIGGDPSAVFMEPKGLQKKDKSGGIKFVDDDASEALTGQPRKVQFDLPSEAFASTYEERVGMLNRPAVPNMLDVGGAVREVLYALDDEAYVDEAADDDFFAALDADEIPEDYKAEIQEAEARTRAGEDDDEDEEQDGEGGAGQGDWYKEFKKYKKGAEAFSDDDDDDEEGSESQSRNPKWDRRTAETSYSVMSSSTMFRNDKLTLLDDQFDQVLGEYSDDEIGELDAEDPSVRGDNLVSKQRLESMFDEFLDATEVMGHKKRLVTRVDRIGIIDSVRDELKENAKDAIRMYQAGEGYMADSKDADIVMPEEKVRDTWDVETVLSTYSNIYNRPALISERTDKNRSPKIRLKGKLGLPVIEEPHNNKKVAAAAASSPLARQNEVENDSEDEEENQEQPVNKGAARSKEESQAEKKMRKAEVKAEKKSRRVEKKATKTAFKDESKRQGKTFRNVLAQEQSLHIE
ncbi:hypothetical protein PhCBS80983_g05530 [Powellomyces hirtus]|uniref:Low temperature viability protein n=1 Tax=Powellomyces hirtus TaxID=109895 RepID=A0A507DUN9_9FUNG|nr:Low temperature viability protein-domain-containing protein [Powellomyces hirtus]TPX55191.1 hypothetical protein PhCBS80983_g05530 [Powellomyces hirtus]